MANATLGISLSLGGESFNKTYSVDADHPNPYGRVTVSAGKTVTSWVKTDSDTAACNLPAGHGYSNGNFDVYWDVAGVTYCRYDVPGTISTNALSLDGGTGTAFPASATANIVVCKQTRINTAIDGDAIKLIGISAEYAVTGETSKVHIGMKDVSDAGIASLLVQANRPFFLDVTSNLAIGGSNPFTGNVITYSLVSNGSASNDCTLLILSHEDSTP